MSKSLTHNIVWKSQWKSKLIIRVKNNETAPRAPLPKMYDWILVHMWQRKFFFNLNGFVCIFFSILKKPQEKCLERQYLCRLSSLLLLFFVSPFIHCTVSCRSGQTKFNLNVNKLNFAGCCSCFCSCCCCSHETVYK